MGHDPEPVRMSLSGGAAVRAWRRVLRGRRFELAIVLCAGLVGCTALPTLGKNDLITFLDAGTVTRDDVYRRLGPPDAKYPRTRAVIYRLGQDEGGYFAAPTRETGLRYNLVLVFKEQDVLQQRALVELKWIPRGRPPFLSYRRDRLAVIARSCSGYSITPYKDWS